MSAPRIEFAPGLFSATMFHPVCSVTFCRTMRVALSVMPPGGYGMIQRMGLLGHAEPCAWMTVETSRARTASADLSGCITKPPREQIAGRTTNPDYERHQDEHFEPGRAVGQPSRIGRLGPL